MLLHSFCYETFVHILNSYTHLLLECMEMTGGPAISHGSPLPLKGAKKYSETALYHTTSLHF